MDFLIKPLEETVFSFEDITALLHAAFLERLNQGLCFTTSRMSASDFQKSAEGGTVLVAFIPETSVLLGTGMIHLRKDETGVCYADLEHKGVLPSVKRIGVGSALEKELQLIGASKGAQYLVSDTAIKARSSIRFHLNNGYFKWLFVSFPSTDYYSVVFRETSFKQYEAG